MTLKPTMNVVCCCRGGNVRSVAARRMLYEDYGFKSVLTCGLEWNDESTLRHLFVWADVILIVGSEDVRKLLLPMHQNDFSYKMEFLNVGQDVWGDHRHQELKTLLRPMIERML